MYHTCKIRSKCRLTIIIDTRRCILLHSISLSKANHTPHLVSPALFGACEQLHTLPGQHSLVFVGQLAELLVARHGHSPLQSVEVDPLLPHLQDVAGLLRLREGGEGGQVKPCYSAPFSESLQ